MKLKNLFLPPLLLMVLHQPGIANPVITVFLRPYPTVEPKKYAENINQKLPIAGKIAQYSFYDKLNYIPTGIFGTYLGFVTLSDAQGQLTFPRKHQAPNITLIITERIIPVPMVSNTLAYWEIEKGSPVAAYSIEHNQDTETGLFYWNVQPAEPPTDNIISPETLILVAKPQHIVVPTGITLTDDSQQLILPDMYIKRGIEKLSNALFILNMNQFFSPISNLYKKDKPDRYSSQINFEQ